MLAGYLLFSSAAYLLSEFRDDFWTRSVPLAGYTITGQDLVDGFGAGNPFAVAGRISFHLGAKSGSIADIILDLLRDYAIIHGSIIAIGLIWSVVRLRPVALAHGPGGETKRQRKGRRLPALGRLPMIWKEVFAEPGMRLHLVLRLLVALIVLASSAAPVLITASYFFDLVYTAGEPQIGTLYYSGHPWMLFREDMNAWVRVMGGVLGTVMLLMVAARAGGSITGERARNTLDDLLTSPLTNAEIVNAKWFGAIFGQRRGLLWLGIVFGIGLCAGGLHIIGALLYLVAWFTYAGFMASLGLLFSAGSRSTFRATLKTMSATLFFLGGHWLLSGLFCYLPMGLMFDRWETRETTDWMIAAQVGVTPPLILGAAPLPTLDTWEFFDGHDRPVKYLIFALFGVVLFLVAGQVLRQGAIVKFAQALNRKAIRGAERPPPKEPLVDAIIVPAEPGKIEAAGPAAP